MTTLTHRQRRAVEQLARRLRDGDTSATARALLADMLATDEPCAYIMPNGALGSAPVAIDEWVASVAARPRGRAPTGPSPDAHVVCPVRVSPAAAEILRARGRAAGAWLSRLIEATRTCDYCAGECDCAERQDERDRDQRRI